MRASFAVQGKKSLAIHPADLELTEHWFLKRRNSEIGTIKIQGSIVKNIKFKVFFTLLLIAFFLLWTMLFAEDRDSADIPTIIHGNLDMSKWNSDSCGVINLSGEWEFFWRKLYSYHDLRDGSCKPDMMARVPAVWNT